ncbi:unnamed protein product [Hydatigera taeniaeformis]|uniref:MADS-box domain-containing protein n=1 Tax=Hydatigena taeniaeformis TaxID=6205 RepID=A0A0R3X1G1_HYDTA|nr:unnamed protein product [Hydatigera taeniaeformis]
MCDDFRLPFKRLCTKEFSLSDLVNEESELYEKSIEIHRNETLEAVIKVYQDPVLLHSWDNFRHAADLLAAMHRRIKHRMNRVLATSYESGSLAFSKNFLNEFGRILRKSNKLVANRALPEGMLNPLLMAQSDPPHGAFKRKRRTLRVRRQCRPLRTRDTITQPKPSSGSPPSGNVSEMSEMSRVSEAEVYNLSRPPASPSIHSKITLEDILSLGGVLLDGVVFPCCWWLSILCRPELALHAAIEFVGFICCGLGLVGGGGAVCCSGEPSWDKVSSVPLRLFCVKMGRKKIDIKKISDEKTLLVTFAKRKVGLFNKAFELSELCECEVAILILTNKNRMHMFASHDLSSVVKQYNDRPDRGELMTSQDIIERRKKKKQSKSSQSEDRSLNQQYPSTCDCGASEYDGGLDNESLVPSTVSTNTTTIAAPADYDDQLAQIGLPQHGVRPHLKPFYPTDGTEEDANVFQASAKLFCMDYSFLVDVAWALSPYSSWLPLFCLSSELMFLNLPAAGGCVDSLSPFPLPAADCAVEAVEPTSPLKMDTDGELNPEEGAKSVLLTDLTLTGAPSISDTLPKKLPRKVSLSQLNLRHDEVLAKLLKGSIKITLFTFLQRLNLGTLRTNRPPAFGDGCKSFDPTIPSPLPTSKRRMPLVFRGSTTTDSELYTPEPHQKPTQVIISDNPDLYQGWSHVNTGPTSLSSSGDGSLTKSTGNVFNGMLPSFLILLLNFHSIGRVKSEASDNSRSRTIDGGSLHIGEFFNFSSVRT